MKKTWEKPKLVILMRNNPAEAVLNGCKSGAQGGPVLGVSFCAANPFSVDPKSEVLVPCPDCSAYAAS